MTENHNFNHTPILIFSAGVVIGILLFGAWMIQGAIVVPTKATDTANTPSSVYTQSDTVTVSNQSAGESVLVDTVTVPPPGVWVAVREVTLEGELGNVLGAARVRTPSSDVTVPLLRGTLPGQSYAIVLYRADNGDEFDLNKNSLYVDFDTGQRVVVPFKTTGVGK